MNNISRYYMTLLTCAVLASGEAGAAGSAPERGTKSSTSAGKADDGQKDVETWLARLQGSFTIKYKVEEKVEACRAASAGLQECRLRKPVTYVSTADCSRTGDGPGLQCAFDKLRQEATGNDAGTAFPFLVSPVPDRIVLGIDPVARKITLIVDSGSLGYTAAASLAGDDAAFKGRCGAPEDKYPCIWTFSIHAPPDGRRIVMTRTRKIGAESSRPEPDTFELSRVEQTAQPRK